MDIKVNFLTILPPMWAFDTSFTPLTRTIDHHWATETKGHQEINWASILSHEKQVFHSWCKDSVQHGWQIHRWAITVRHCHANERCKHLISQRGRNILCNAPFSFTHFLARRNLMLWFFFVAVNLLKRQTQSCQRMGVWHDSEDFGRCWAGIFRNWSFACFWSQFCSGIAQTVTLRYTWPKKNLLL